MNRIFPYLGKKSPSVITYKELADIYRQLQLVVFSILFSQYVAFFKFLKSYLEGVSKGNDSLQRIQVGMH